LFNSHSFIFKKLKTTALKFYRTKTTNNENSSRLLSELGGLITTTLLILSFLIPSSISAQKPPENDAEFEKTYKRRIRQEQLFRVYIPKDLTQAFIELNRKIDKESRAKFIAIPEEVAERKLFFSLGRWIIHNWGFYGGSRLSEYMKTQFDVHHPEDMASFIIIAYHRNLKREPLNIKQLVEYFAEKKAKEKAAQHAKGKVIFEETRTRENKN
jgi:hypothetical protein